MGKGRETGQNSVLSANSKQVRRSWGVELNETEGTGQCQAIRGLVNSLMGCSL